MFFSGASDRTRIRQQSFVACNADSLLPLMERPKTTHLSLSTRNFLVVPLGVQTDHLAPICLRLEISSNNNCSHSLAGFLLQLPSSLWHPNSLPDSNLQIQQRPVVLSLIRKMKNTTPSRYRLWNEILVGVERAKRLLSPDSVKYTKCVRRCVKNQSGERNRDARFLQILSFVLRIYSTSSCLRECFANRPSRFYFISTRGIETSSFCGLLYFRLATMFQ